MSFGGTDFGCWARNVGVVKTFNETNPLESPHNGVSTLGTAPHATKIAPMKKAANKKTNRLKPMTDKHGKVFPSFSKMHFPFFTISPSRLTLFALVSPITFECFHKLSKTTARKSYLYITFEDKPRIQPFS